MRLEFPETRASGHMMASFLNSGRHPLISEEARRAGRPGQSINLALTPVFPVQPVKPGETIDLTLDAGNYELKKFLAKRHPADTLAELDLTLDFVLYDDGTANSVGGNVRRSDPNRPNVWIPFDAKNQE